MVDVNDILYKMFGDKSKNNCFTKDLENNSRKVVDLMSGSTICGSIKFGRAKNPKRIPLLVDQRTLNEINSIFS